MRTGKGYVFRACGSQGASTVALLWQRLKAGRDLGELHGGEREGFRRVP